MRGKVIDTLSGKFVIRITPAYAGKRKLIYKHVIKRQDHPRLCGEKRRVFHIKNDRQGSPPPMRGKVAG